MNNSPITIRGNLVDDPEIKEIGSGIKKATFTVAVNYRFRKNDDWEEETSFLNVVAWRFLAENLEPILEKGMAVIVTGRMVQRSYENDEGQRRYVHEINADDIGVSVNRISSVTRRTSSGGSSSAQTATANDDYGPEEAPW